MIHGIRTIFCAIQIESGGFNLTIAPWHHQSFGQWSDDVMTTALQCDEDCAIDGEIAG